MTASEAISKMQSAVLSSKEKFEGMGFVMSVETDYMNSFYKTVTDVNKAKFVTVSLVIGAKDGKEGEEYCMSLGAAITHGKVDEVKLDSDIEHYGEMVNEALNVLEGYDDKDEGLGYLTAKASEEYEKFLAKIQEENKKSRKASMIVNIVFILGVALLFIIAFLR